MAESAGFWETVRTWADSAGLLLPQEGEPGDRLPVPESVCAHCPICQGAATVDQLDHRAIADLSELIRNLLLGMGTALASAAEQRLHGESAPSPRIPPSERPPPRTRRRTPPDQSAETSPDQTPPRPASASDRATRAPGRRTGAAGRTTGAAARPGSARASGQGDEVGKPGEGNPPRPRRRGTARPAPERSDAPPASTRDARDAEPNGGASAEAAPEASG